MAGVGFSLISSCLPLPAGTWHDRCHRRFARWRVAWGQERCGGGLVGIAVGHKGEIGVGKLFWMGLGWIGAGQEPPFGRKTVLQGEADRSG